MTEHRRASYWLTWLALLVLAGASFGLSTVAPPSWGMVLAMAVAVCKALLIVFFFMHVARYAVSARLALVVAVTLIGLLGAFMAADLCTRESPTHALQGAGAR